MQTKFTIKPWEDGKILLWKETSSDTGDGIMYWESKQLVLSEVELRALLQVTKNYLDNPEAEHYVEVNI